MNEIIEILKMINDGIDYESCDNIMTGKYLDSLQIVMLINTIEEKYKITIEPDLITPENFNSAEAIWKMLKGIK